MLKWRFKAKKQRQFEKKGKKQRQTQRQRQRQRQKAQMFSELNCMSRTTRDNYKLLNSTVCVMRLKGFDEIVRKL